ncbi:methyltransferase [uncultured Desulfovibrio sp.]|uniref:Methyltransferase domain-containing protein n=1 Tax=Candidatus Desulfovibrio intestinavium TaxID=2838534 RepID=A0A9D2HQI3_9BACT|nr:methyltransferase [uncultured Desulfovibrio sp.]HJA79698.1 methyltransferase domain-containing protein [Candidatus Desulfovibrio intestinavium]
MRQWTATAFLQASGMFWESFALHAALALDVFTPLAAGPLPIEELARQTGCSRRGLDMLATALCALDLLRRTEDGRCELLPFARQYLCRGEAAYLGYMVGHHRGLVPGWSRLAEAVRTGRDVCDTAPPPTENRECFLMGMRNVANAQASLSVPHIDLGGRQRLLDLGGGTGAYAVRFCREHPELTATVFDLPASRPFAERVLQEEGLTDRIRFVAGDFTRDALPSGFEVAWLSQILHGLHRDTAAEVVRKAGQALTDGGLLLIQEFALDDDRMGPLHPALFSLNMLVGTRDGQAYTQAELTAFMHAAGADEVRVLPLELPQGCRILAGTIRHGR